MNGRSQNGQYSNLYAANVSINCADEKPRYTISDVQAGLPALPGRLTALRRLSGLGHAELHQLGRPGAADHPDVSATGAAPILVVGNTGDPATPYQGAKKMVDALGKASASR